MHCRIAECQKPVFHKSKQLCSMHYARWQRHRDTSVRLTLKGATTEEIAAAFWQRVSKTSTCWLWAGTKNNQGYGVTSSRGYAHRFSFELHNGPFDKSLDVLHRCDTPLCVRPDHLFLGTALDNLGDMARKGRASSILTEDIVREMKTLYLQGKTPIEINSAFPHIKRSTIQAVVSGQNWRWVEADGIEKTRLSARASQANSEMLIGALRENLRQ